MLSFVFTCSLLTLYKIEQAAQQQHDLKMTILSLLSMLNNTAVDPI